MKLNDYFYNGNILLKHHLELVSNQSHEDSQRVMIQVTHGGLVTE